MAQNFCPNCGAQLDGAKKFCTSCGQSLTAQAAAPAQPAQAAQPQQQQYIQQPVYQPQAPAKKKSKAPVIIIIVVLLIAALAAAAYFTNGFGLLGGEGGLFGGKDNPSPGTTQNGGNNSTSTPAKETKVGDVIKFGDYNWYVIDVDLLNKKALIITDKVIGNRAWHDTDMGNDAKVTWADCDLRAYLNGEFYKSLPEDFKSRIVEVVNQNPENDIYRPSESDPATNDKVFLLSVNEVKRYIEADVLTAMADDQKWWLRSPGMEGFYAAGVGHNEIYAGGYYASADDNGVRPALWITLGESTQHDTKETT